jgi:hypothetical protein
MALAPGMTLAPYPVVAMKLSRKVGKLTSYAMTTSVAPQVVLFFFFFLERRK